MRVVFMGTPQFAVPSLESLAETHDVVAAFTRPDAVSGRGGAKRPSAVKVAARARGIPVMEPVTLRSPDALATLADLRPDIVVVAAYGLILPPDVLGVAPQGTVNVHASLLPRWRGAAPVQRAILAGDTVSGVSIMRVEAGLDTGPYCLQLSTPVADKSAAELTDELARLGAEALGQALRSIAEGSVTWREQDDSLATYAAKVTKDDVAVSPNLPAEQIVRRIRASLPAAPTRAVVAGRGVTLVAGHVSAETVAPGRPSATRDALMLGASDGSVAVTVVKPDGKAEMAAADWARGLKDMQDATWESAR